MPCTHHPSALLCWLFAWLPCVASCQVQQLISWLKGHVPAEDGSSGVAAVVHGDFRLDNLVLDQQLQVRHTQHGGLCNDLLCSDLRPKELAGYQQQSEPSPYLLYLPGPPGELGRALGWILASCVLGEAGMHVFRLEQV